jgi:conjugative transfer signal peptidase TraF
MKRLFARKAGRRFLGLMVSAAATIGAVAILAASLPRPLLLWNQTASEPEGLYFRGSAAPRPGAIIAFQAPAAAFPYADRRMAYLRRVPILKAVAAGENDRVCTNGGVLTINGRPRGQVLSWDSHGDRPPAWRACRVLTRGEFFVFSDRVPNSFDSRYYGPIDQASILGVFAPLLVTANPARDA